MKVKCSAFKLSILFLFLCVISSPALNAQSPYVNVASNMGINHTYLLNNAGGGASFVDFDMDGKDDITLATGAGEEIHFYRNNGNGFDQINLGIDNVEEAKSVIWADIDNDGDKDLYVAAFAGTNHLYENKGNLQFEQITESSGLPIDTFKSFGAIFGDFNRDGFLDLYYTERPFAGSGTVNRNRLFKNLGQNNFEEVTYSANVADEARLPFCAAFLDYNDDKWPDIYIANDRKKRNTLLQNNQGVYTDVTDQCNAGIEIDAMNVGVGDIDNDGLNDIYVTNTPSGSALLKCIVNPDNEEVEFTEEAESRGVGFFGIGWGANFLDANNDGWQDLYVSGMQIGSDVISSEMYMNDGTGYFTQVQDGFVGDTVTSFVNAVGDFDEDGYPDIVVNNSEYFLSQLWTAETGNNNWIKIDLKGVKSNRDGIGSKIELYANEMYQMKYTHCGIAFMGQNSNTQLFGLANLETIDSLRITWPTGHIDIIENPDINTTHQITEGQSTDGIISVDSDVTILSSTNEQDDFADLVLRPNPVTNYLTLDIGNDFLTDVVYRIVDISANSIQEKTLKSEKIDVSHLIPGVYFLQLKRHNKTVKSLKFIKI